MCLAGRPHIEQTPVAQPWGLRAIASQGAIAPAGIWINAGEGRIPEVPQAPQDANLPNIAIGTAATL